MADPDYVEIDEYEEDVTAMESECWDTADALTIEGQEQDVVEQLNTTTGDCMPMAIEPDTRDLDLCLICQTDTDEHMNILSRGKDTFLQHCQNTGHTELLQYVNADVKLLLHGSCRRRLAYEASAAVNEAAAQGTVQRLTRSVTGSFSFKDMCFLCGESVSGSRDVRKVLSGDDFDSKMRHVIRKRNLDNWAVTVQGRLDAISDLFAADAVYHRNCHTRFTGLLGQMPHNIKRGRPKNEEATVAFNTLCLKLEDECENEMYTLSQLHDMMCDMFEYHDDSGAYSRKYLKGLLQERYGEHIYFASRPGRDDVVGFSGFCDLVLHNKFISDRNEGEGTEAEKLVQKAAGLILAEIREMDTSRKFYPTAEDIKSDGLSFVPSLLTLLLKRLIRPPLKQRGIGQAIVQAARPLGSIMPLLFGVGVDLEQCAGQDVHLKLSRLGFTLSTDEIRRYRQSVTKKIPVHNSTDSTSNRVPVANYVGDNVDHNSRTLDGWTEHISWNGNHFCYR